ncbi:MAG: carboxypeptidase-like regulatory domain-containing protein [Flavobacteriales bacterium]|nr:carboxypeptidase-like regulatory domain-containing protein [Flavobacteriales bacterium]
MKNMYKFLLFVALVTLSGSAYAQEIYKGVVTDSETGRPISNVDVRFSGTVDETTTDANGAFTITRIGDTQSLVFNHSDYDDATYVTSESERTIEIVMHSRVRIDQYGQKVDNRKVLTTESWDGFIHWESKDKQYRLWMDNRIFLDGAYYMDNYDKDLTAAENQAKGQLDVPSQMLKLRRMRFALKAQVSEHWYGEIDFDFDGNIVDIKDAYIRRFLGDWGQVRVGQFRMPQGMQQTTTSRYLKLMERASVYKFNPNRKLGVAFSTWSDKYMFGLGVHTEEIRNDHDQIEGDPNYFKGEMQGAEPMLGVSTRAAYYLINKPGRLISFGGGYSTRTPGRYKFPDNRVKYDPKDETTVSGIEFVTAKVNNVNMASNYNVELAVSRGSWRMSGEYYYNTLSRNDGLSTVKFNGFYVQTAWLITGERHRWNYREAEFTAIRPRGKKGAIEVAARYSYMNLNDFDANIKGGEKGQYTLGINYYVSRNVKFVLNYSYVDHDRYADSDGDFTWAVRPDAPVGESGFDYGMLQWRCEIDF